MRLNGDKEREREGERGEEICLRTWRNAFGVSCGLVESVGSVDQLSLYWCCTKIDDEPLFLSLCSFFSDDIFNVNFPNYFEVTVVFIS